ncbi:MAG TPA: hypothetical protein VMV03_01730 [Spirochaetia bacterium]|nr:hypothetical protein [Spirochaetia bacterium]
MSVREGVRTYLSDRLVLRTCLYLAAALGAAVLAAWPRASLEAIIRTGASSDTFTVVAMAFLVCLLFLGARFGAQDFSPDPAVQLPEHVRLTAVSLLGLVGGRASFAVLHTILLLLLGAPFLAAAAAVGGAGLTHVARALAILGAAGLAGRAIGLLSNCIMGARRPLRDIALYLFLVAVLIATFLVATAASPFYGLYALLEPSEGFPEWLVCVAANLLLAAAFWGLSILALAVVRARARSFMKGHGNG